MDTITALKTRRSIRKYTDQPVSDELIRDIIELGMYAPSAGNAQPWHFIVIRNRQTLDAIPDIHPYAAMTKSATVAILVCADPSLEKYKGRWMLDCSAAAQNILLGAHSKGLGAVWVGIYPEEERMEGMKKLLRLPDQIIPLALIPIGYPAVQASQPDRWNSERVHNETW